MSTSSTEPSTTVVVVGEALVDVVWPKAGEVRHSPGGSPLNVAVGLSRLGLATILVTQIGDDVDGRLVEDHVRASGVRLHQSSQAGAGRRTNTATAHLDETGSATYEFDLAWDLPPLELPAEASALHVGSLGALLRPGRESVLDLIGQARRRGLLVSYDPNARPALTPDAEAAWTDVGEVTALADVVKMSEEDLHFLRPGSSARDLADEVLAGGAALFVLTSGGDGAVAFTAATSASVPSQPADVVDTVGAGDSFMAALITVVVEHGLQDLDEDRLAAYLRAAHEVGRVTVSRRGADPPTRAELPPGWPGID